MTSLGCALAAVDLDVRQLAPTAAVLLGIDPPKDAELGAVTAALLDAR